jgi:hypothetical protein
MNTDEHGFNLTRRLSETNMPCHSMLEQDKEALKIFRAEGEKRFSLLDGCIRWPVISRHVNELTAIRDELLRAKRSLTDLPTA